MEALIQIATDIGFDANSIMLLGLTAYTWLTRRDFNRHEADCRVHRERMYNMLVDLRKDLGDIDVRLAKLEGSFENVPCRE